MGLDFDAGYDAGQRSATKAMQDRIGAMHAQLTALQAENERLTREIAELRELVGEWKRDFVALKLQSPEATFHDIPDSQYGKLALSAVWLLKAATGPDDGPTSWSKTRDDWMEQAERLFAKSAVSTSTTMCPRADRVVDLTDGSWEMILPGCHRRGNEDEDSQDSEAEGE